MRKASLIAVFAVGGSIAMSVPTFAGNWVDRGSAWEYHENGSRVTNRWVQGANSQTWYYIKGNGKMANSEWVQSNGVWYYMNSNGAMAVNQWVQSNGAWYYMNSDGAMLANQWIQSGGSWYYMGGNGVMVTNQRIGGYELGSDGKMKASTGANTTQSAGKSKSGYSVSDLIGTYSGYVYTNDGQKEDASVSIYEDKGEVFAEIYYARGEDGEVRMRYHVTGSGSEFQFSSGAYISGGSWFERTLWYEYDKIKFDGTRLKTDFKNSVYYFSVDKD